MEGKTKNLCAQIPIGLHERVIGEKDARGMTLSEYVTLVLKEYYEGRTNTMQDTKTIAFQVSPELNQRLKNYLTKHGLTQKQFFTDLLEKILSEDGE